MNEFSQHSIRPLHYYSDCRRQSPTATGEDRATIIGTVEDSAGTVRPNRIGMDWYGYGRRLVQIVLPFLAPKHNVSGQSKPKVTIKSLSLPAP